MQAVSLLYLNMPTGKAICYWSNRCSKRSLCALAVSQEHAGGGLAESECAGQEREAIQARFCQGKVRVVTATVAFGMGLDAPGVGGVVHLTLPRSLEEYVQQASRHHCPARLCTAGCLPFVPAELDRVSVCGCC